MTTPERLLLALTLIFFVPYLVWRLGRTEYYAPLVVVQIVTGIVLGPGVLGQFAPLYFQSIFQAEVVAALNGIAAWAVILFVFIAGIELDLRQAWVNRRESGVTAGLALGMPLLTGAVLAWFLSGSSDWSGSSATPWQFMLGVGMSCAVTALPILILLMEKLSLFRAPLGQRILRYASLDDIALWAVLALLLLDWQKVLNQLFFLSSFALLALAVRWMMRRVSLSDRWYLCLIWLAVCAFGADWAGLHYMVGAFLAGAVIDSDWFNQAQLDGLRQNVLLVLMPVFFLSTGLRTQWEMGGEAVVLVALALLVAATAGKLMGVHMAGRLLGWPPGEASVIAWLLQTKALIMIIFANVLLDRAIITSAMFTSLLLMAVMSTMLTVPMVSRRLHRTMAGESTQ